MLETKHVGDKFEMFVRKPALQNKNETVFMLKRQAVHNVFSISLYNFNIYRNHNLFKLENFDSSSILKS